MMIHKRFRPLFFRGLPVLMFACLTTLLASCATPERDLPDGLYAAFNTAKGEILVELEPELAPVTVMNFVGLAEGTIENDFRPDRPFYDGLVFHRVEPGFVIQGGDPAGNGSGGPGYRFPTETHPELTHDGEGVLAMANSGPNTNGSQFYITLTATPFLDGGYNVFGQVIEGMEVVRSIEVGDVIRSVEIIRSGEEAQSFQPTTESFQAARTALAAEQEAAVAAELQARIDAVTEGLPNLIEFGESRMLLSLLQPGSGETPETGTAVSVHYSFSTLEGEILDDTRARGEPFTFSYNEQRVLPGLEMAIGTMRPGAQLVAIIPPELAWGAQGLPPALAPDSFVVFDIERLQ
jgi:cyclophilin family peptidyl-prolyl cis-trans isomerase